MVSLLLKPYTLECEHSGERGLPRHFKWMMEKSIPLPKENIPDLPPSWYLHDKTHFVARWRHSWSLKKMTGVLTFHNITFNHILESYKLFYMLKYTRMFFTIFWRGWWITGCLKRNAKLLILSISNIVQLY